MQPEAVDREKRHICKPRDSRLETTEFRSLWRAGGRPAWLADGKNSAKNVTLEAVSVGSGGRGGNIMRKELGTKAESMMHGRGILCVPQGHGRGRPNAFQFLWLLSLQADTTHGPGAGGQKNRGSQTLDRQLLVQEETMLMLRSIRWKPGRIPGGRFMDSPCAVRCVVWHGHFPMSNTLMLACL